MLLVIFQVFVIDMLTLHLKVFLKISIQVILLNNYDSETGDFKVNVQSRNE